MSGIVLQNAWFDYGDQPVLRGASLSLERGESAVVTGANASGKSTLLYVCAGLLPLRRGAVQLAGMPVDTAHPEELVRRGVRRGAIRHGHADGLRGQGRGHGQQQGGGSRGGGGPGEVREGSKHGVAGALGFVGGRSANVGA